jgi:hypothetical protein
MARTKAQNQSLVRDALRDHFPWTEVDSQGEPLPDTRPLLALRKEFEQRHLGQLVSSYQNAQAQASLEEVDIAGI